MSNIIPVVQIITSVLLIVVILLQRQGAGLSGVFGGSDGSYHTKRGFEKILFISTIILAALFLLSSFSALLI